jgi:pyrroline-5-carboxylate reductase
VVDVRERSTFPGQDRRRRDIPPAVSAPIAVIGAGELASSLVTGLSLPAYVSDNGSGRARRLAESCGGSFGPSRDIPEGAITFLAHPVGSLDEVAQEIDGRAGCAVSLLSGVRQARLESCYFRSPVVRATVTAAARIRRGIVSWPARRQLPPPQDDVLRRLLASLGTLIEIEEPVMTSLIPLAGVAPAYYAMMIEAQADAAVAVGLPAHLALAAAVESAAAGVALIKANGGDTAATRRSVTTPGGRTARGLGALDAAGVGEAFRAAARAVVSDGNTTTAGPDCDAVSLARPLLAFPDLLARAGKLLAGRQSALPDGWFAPAWSIDLADTRVRSLLDTPPMRVLTAAFDGVPLHLLDLMGLPEVRTTKAWASLLMVARAVTHIRETGERVVLVTPTSGNKGAALRHAVARAHSLGIVDEASLRIACLVPRASTYKFQDGPLSRTPRLRALNQVFVCDTEEPADVKNLGLAVCESIAGRLARQGTRTWYTLYVRNYLLADAVRAFVDRRISPPPATAGKRVHAHAVSSAFGLLGYEFGREVLREAGHAADGADPAYLIIQHLRTPDMVLDWRFGSFDRCHLPRYRPHPDGTGVEQTEDPHFPYFAGAADEQIDPTFYTRSPATAPAMSSLLHARGRGGVVVSMRDCAVHLPRTRRLCARFGIDLPEDISQLREWSLVMAMTGVQVARERSIVDAADEIVLHASGSYAAGQYRALPEKWCVPANRAEIIAAAIRDAGSRG